MSLGKKPGENGSTSMTALTSMVSLGLAFAYSQNSADKTRLHVKEAKHNQVVESTEINDTNNLSRFRAMIADKRLPDGRYQPLLAARNYFDGTWTLMVNNNLKGDLKGVELSGKSSGVTLKSVKNQEIKANQVEKVMANGSAAAELDTENKNVRIVHVNRDPGNLTLVQSLDVEIPSNEQGKQPTRARINVNVPAAYNPILEISPRNANRWSRNFNNIHAGIWDFRVLASGIVYSAKVNVNGQFDIPLGGYGLNGKISHTANNSLAENREIGRFGLDMTPGKSIDPLSCKLNPIDFNFNITVKLVGADMKEAPGQFTVQSLKVVGFNKDHTLDEGGFKNSCPNQCPFLSDRAADGGWLEARLEQGRSQQINSRRYQDYSWSHLFDVTRNQLGDKTIKICESIQNPSELHWNKYGSPSPVTVINEFWDELQYFSYQEPACERRFLFARHGCGCFAADTKIRMEDGSEKLITELTRNDRVWNPVLKRGMGIRRMTQGPEKVPMFRIQSSGKSVVVTGHHPFSTETGIKAAFDLEAGDRIRDKSGAWARIDAIDVEPVKADAVVWNLELEGSPDEQAEHFVEANGIVTGDLYLQTKLQNAATHTAKADEILKAN